MGGTMEIKTASLFTLFILIFTVFPAEAANWAMLQGDVYHSGITSDRAPSTTPNSSFSWEYQLNGGVLTSPVVVDGVVYVLSVDNKITAVNVTDGEEIWQVSSSGAGAIADPAYGNGQLFAATGDGYIYSFDADTGASRWSKQINTGIVSTPIVYYDEKLYFGAGSAYYCYTDSGALKWIYSSPTSATYKGSCSVVIDDYIVYGDNSGHLLSLESSDGTVSDEIDGQEVADIYGSPVDGISSAVVYSPEYQRIYFTSNNGSCYYLGFDPQAGAFYTSDAGKSNIFTSTKTSPVIYNNRVYLTGESAGSYYLRCLNADDLSTIWSFQVSEEIVHSPVISFFNDAEDGEVFIYFGTTIGTIYCIKDEDGSVSPSEQWSYSQYGVTTFPSGLAISSGKLLFGTASGYLVGLGNTLLPVADFDAYPKMGVIPMTVSFTDRSSNAITWEWDVNNDGDVDYITKNCQHTYSYVGRYTVSLKITNSFGEDTEIKADYIVLNAQAASGGKGGYKEQNTTNSSVEPEEEEVFVIDMGATASPNIDFGKDEVSVEDVPSKSDTGKKAYGFTAVVSSILVSITAYYLRKKI